ncbi:hypothetical protein HYALB_00010292 [Hymenoscyphus albidus]|uniref:Uncharacterized protein n=1 Tax=Hymenoscyphus albidus TaxID=595503 RepID=A0A9N9LPT9_9HELO|nr:hypothetical protein HYALB_00010292 [Hymenoscyphus albidus]
MVIVMCLKTVKIGRPEDLGAKNIQSQDLYKARIEEPLNKELQDGKKASSPQIKFMDYGDIIIYGIKKS